MNPTAESFESARSQAFEEFKATAVSDSQGGFLVEGDIWAPDEDALYDIWMRQDFGMVGPLEEAFEHSTGELDAGAEDDIGAVVAKLRSHGRLLTDTDITYCISSQFNDAQQGVIRNGIQTAASKWQRDTGVGFRFVAQSSCTNATNSVDFNVRLMTRGEIDDAKPVPVAASAWFPGWSRGDRELRLVSSAIPTNTGNAGFIGLMTHELGHMHGFVHEHSARKDQGCPAASSSAVTRFDRESIMIYAGCDGGTPTNELSRYDRLGARCAYKGECEWLQRPGNAVDVAAANGQVWVVGTSRRPFRLRRDGTWETMPGNNGAAIALEPNGTPWLVTTDNAIHRFNASANRWDRMPGRALDIGAGGGSVWVVGTSRRLFRWNGSGWTQQPTGDNGHRITVDKQGRPWIVNTSNKIFRLTNSGWVQQPGRALDIAAGADGSVWVTGTSEGVFEFRFQSGEWVQTTGRATRIAVADSGTPWVLNSNNRIYSNLWE